MKKLILIIPVILAVSIYCIFTTASPVSKGKKKKGPVFFDYIYAKKGEFPKGAYQTWNSWVRQNKKAPQLLSDIISMGPSNIGGRTRAIQWGLDNPAEIYAGAISGGLWTSSDSGRNWKVVNDYQANLNITHITQNPFNPDVLYYCTGEGAGNSSAAAGAGIFKSTDGGASFTQLPASTSGPFDYTWRIRHSLVDSQTIFIATQSSGLYRSLDGGQTFERIYLTSRPIHDLEVFSDSTVMFTVQGLGIFSCINGNPGTFVEKGNNLPVDNQFGRVEIAYCGSQDNVLYAAYGNINNDALINVYRSNDRGNTWTATQRNPTVAGVRFLFTWYCLTLNVKYNDPDAVIIGSVEAGYSGDGGINWIKLKNSHSDYHTIEVHPQRPEKVIIGNDGGIFEYKWTDLQYNFVDLNKGYTTYQCYAGTYTPTGVSVLTGSQDNGTNYNKTGNTSYNKVYGADGSYTHVHQQNPGEAYLSWQNGHIRKTLDYAAPTPSTFDIMNDLDANRDEEIDDGAWFIHPFAINYLDGEQLFFPTKRRLFRSTSGGVIWDAITNNINVGSTQQPFAIGISNQTSPAAYIGGSNGLFYRVRNALFSAPGEEVSLRALSPNAVRSSFIGCVKVNPVYHNVVYIGLTNYSANPRIYRIDKADADTPVWVDISGNLPLNLPVNWIEVDPASPDSVIFAGTDFGLFYTDNGGATWYKDPVIPNVVIDMLQIRPSDRRLFIFTHGRGVWSAKILPEGKPIPPHNQLAVNKAGGIDVSFYPNPTREKVRVNWNAASVQTMNVSVVDLKGRVLKTVNLSSGETIDLSDVPAGVYFFTDGKRFSSRVVKM